MKSSLEQLRCPRCKSSLNQLRDAYRCLSCSTTYRVILGIPDFRWLPDCSSEFFEDDVRKARLLAERSENLDLIGMLKLCREITPNVSADQVARFAGRSAALVAKGEECLELIESLATYRNHPTYRRVLEIGCGSGGFLVAAKRKYPDVVGTDIALRWLVIARKRLRELGLNVPLVCCCAEHLPFEDSRFDIILAEDVLEHVKNQESTLRECRRVMRPEGIMFIGTPNRFSLTPEPHVGAWGVGLLPRKWMNAYVQLVKGLPYENIHLLSFVQLRRLLRKCHLEDHQILLPAICAEEAKSFSAVKCVFLKIYDAVKMIPLVRAVLYLVAPFFHVVAFTSKR